MSGPDKRIEARDKFDPGAVAKETRDELGKAMRAIKSLQETVEHSKEAIRHSQELIARIPDR